MRFSPKYVISQEHRFVYCVVPLVACTSLKSALLPLFDPDGSKGETYRSTDRFGRPFVNVHKLFDDSPHQLRREGLLRGLRRGIYSNYFVFAFVRNPFDRLVSCYLKKVAKRNLLVHQESIRGGMPFQEFVEAAHAIPDDRADAHLRSQHFPLHRPNGRPVPNFVGRFEDLSTDFVRVKSRIGTMDLELPHLLPSPNRNGRDYREFYDRRTRRLTEERYADDLEVFGYSF